MHNKLGLACVLHSSSGWHPFAPVGVFVAVPPSIPHGSFDSTGASVGVGGISLRALCVDALEAEEAARVRATAVLPRPAAEMQQGAQVACPIDA